MHVLNRQCFPVILKYVLLKIFAYMCSVLRIRIRIRIHRIRMFLGLLDPDPDPLFRGMDSDPDPDPFVITLNPIVL
jgi:hypothetical protein